MHVLHMEDGIDEFISYVCPSKYAFSEISSLSAETIEAANEKRMVMQVARNVKGRY